MNQFAALEAVLFAFGDEGIALDQIPTILGLNEEETQTCIETFKESYDNEARGFYPVEYGGVLKFVTKPLFHDIIAELVHFNKNRQLSQAALETLAIIAYKQPITRVEIEEIRGVNSDMMCRRLEALDLIRESGRADSIGRPILYEVTPSFMDVFKLTSLKELPEIKLNAVEDEHELFRRD